MVWSDAIELAGNCIDRGWCVETFSLIVDRGVMRKLSAYHPHSGEYAEIFGILNHYVCLSKLENVIIVKIAPVLHFFCGKMASGKTTLSRKLASDYDAVLISEDLWLSKLYPEEISTFDDYLRYSLRLKSVVSRHVQNILAQEISVILDFPGNVPSQRQWFRSIFEAAKVDHVLHYIVASDFLCKEQLRKRNAEQPEGSMIMSESDFDYITSYFQPPTADESFNIIKYDSN